jgi:gluconolactonase
MRQISWVLVSFIVVAGASFSPESGAQSGGDWAREAGAGTILRLDPRFDALVPADARIEKIADGFVFIEGPIWLRDEGRLLFSDVRGNAIYQWSEADGVSPFIDPVYDGLIAGMRTVGSNGLTLDTGGRLIICEHSGRMISRLESDGTRTTLVDHYNGHRLNSPNDVVYSADGWMYFTDPSYGLEGLEDSPLRELDFNGVYRLSPSGELELLTRDQTRPNGIALSPDESTLYVANSDPEKALWMAYDIGPHGVSNPRVFYDVTDEEGEVGADGLKVDNAGNLFATGAGRVWVFSPDGTHLGTIRPDESPANVGWGDDGSTLYMTARTGLYRIRLSTAGAMP